MPVCVRLKWPPATCVYVQLNYRDINLAGSWQELDILHHLLLSRRTALSRHDTDAFEDKRD